MSASVCGLEKFWIHIDVFSTPLMVNLIRIWNRMKLHSDAHHAPPLDLDSEWTLRISLKPWHCFNFTHYPALTNFELRMLRDRAAWEDFNNVFKIFYSFIRTILCIGSLDKGLFGKMGFYYTHERCKPHTWRNLGWTNAAPPQTSQFRVDKRHATFTLIFVIRVLLLIMYSITAL